MLLDLINQEFIKGIELPENYKNIKLENDTIDNFLETIISKTKVDIPEQLVQAYKNDVYNRLKIEAENYQKEINTYVKEKYDSNNVEEYLKKHESEYEDIIKEDLVYQKILEELGIKITDDDIKKEYSNLINNGKTIEEIKNNYGEKLVYKYTIIYKIKETLFEK